MNAEILRSAGIDYDGGVKRFMGRAPLYEKTLAKFPRDGAFGRARAAWAADDREGLLAAVHEFKGMCGNISLTGLYKTAEELVALLRRGTASHGELAGVYERLDRQYDAACAAVRAAAEVQA